MKKFLTGLFIAGIMAFAVVGCNSECKDGCCENCICPEGECNCCEDGVCVEGCECECCGKDGCELDN